MMYPDVILILLTVFLVTMILGIAIRIYLNETRVFPKFRQSLKKGDVVLLPEHGRAIYRTPDPEDDKRVLVSISLNSLYPSKDWEE